MVLTQQKGFLSLGGEAFHKHRSRKAESPSQERNFDELTAEFDRRFTKVKLCSLPRRKIERDVGRFRALAQLLDEQTHSGFSKRNPKLAQLCPHAMGRPALFGGPALQPLILLKPFLNVRQCGVTHRSLELRLTLILANTRRWLLLKELSDSIAREPKVAGRGPLALALDQDPGANFISKCHGIHLFFLRSLEISFKCSGFSGLWLTFLVASGSLSV